MTKETGFAPDWLSPPGDTIATILEERGLSPSDLARKLRRSAADIANLLTGDAALTDEIASELSVAFGSTPEFWRKRESRYRRDLARLEQEASLPSNQAWLSRLPIKDMVEWGWITPARQPVRKVLACLQFFGVASAQAWRENYTDVLQAVAFRTSPTFKSEPEAVAAWLRQGEIEASSIKCQDWNPERFRDELTRIRSLTRQNNPDVFLPTLIEKCARCGVAVVVLRAPRKCRASGATRFLSPERPMLLLSFRYRADDHFWFTFFHEAGHLLLHGNKSIFIEGPEKQSSKEEDEANAFAETVLIPSQFQEEMYQLTANKIAVIRFARKVGVSRGIVVGQLQHYKVIGQRQLNDLKRRYSWSVD
jgi:plasmid maintenance system antidote protein VapI/Zn-dependent peptidase ImmA (M78 family)